MADNIFQLVDKTTNQRPLGVSGRAAVYDIAAPGFEEFILKTKQFKAYGKMEMSRDELQLLLNSSSSLSSPKIFAVDYRIGSANYGQPLATFTSGISTSRFFSTINMKVQGKGLANLYLEIESANHNESKAIEYYHKLIGQVTQNEFNELGHCINDIMKRGGMPDFDASNIMFDNGKLHLMDVRPRMFPDHAVLFQSICNIILKPVKLKADTIKNFDETNVSVIVEKIHNSFRRNNIKIYDINSKPIGEAATDLEKYMSICGTKDFFNDLSRFDKIKSISKDFEPFPSIPYSLDRKAFLIKEISPISFSEKPETLLNLLQNTKKLLAKQEHKLH